MEFTVSGNSLKTFARAIICLARIGNDLVVQASPSKLDFHTLNSSRSAYKVITFSPDFFDVYTVNGAQIKCSVLLKAVCSVLRTPITNIDNLAVQLPDPDASKVCWTLECYNGIRKIYGITCNVDPDIQQLSLDKGRYHSNFVVRPRDLNRLLANFQSSLQEITIIATERNSLPADVTDGIGGKAVELRSYLDPMKENDSSLHTQLWIDPVEEFVQYTHSGDPVDVTFGVKELKAFISFCEGCEVDIHLYFEKAGEPILMTPRYGDDDGAISNFNATLVLATMLSSQLHEGNNTSEFPAETARMQDQTESGTALGAQHDKNGASGSDNLSNHTRIWSELTGSAAAAGSGSGSNRRNASENRNSNVVEAREIQRISNIQISKVSSSMGIVQTGIIECNCQVFSQRHLSNWVEPGDEEDEEDDDELCVQCTPPYHEE
ncbi:hypothetical protein SAY86_029139 [Trapa natans]|uniref:Cell cycle checkpoint control protein RAD9A n=1 Tax=Trapa natans TaxID=22666 RepID=A0AAN7LW00_TRANT|nr:hypothetical protein SAY86_029139 [Trapa natans]